MTRVKHDKKNKVKCPTFEGDKEEEKGINAIRDFE
jgi:hypothetical protein